MPKVVKASHNKSCCLFFFLKQFASSLVIVLKNFYSHLVHPMENPRRSHWYKPNEARKSHDEIRANLLQFPAYVASPDFLRTTSWVASIAQDTLRRASINRFSPFHVSIVGVVSPQNLYMQPHGNFSTEPSSPYGQTTSIFAQAEYKFSLSPPLRYPSFMEDFEKAIQNIRMIYSPVETPKEDFWWEPDTSFIQSPLDETLLLTEHKPVFNWSFPIFDRTILTTSRLCFQ
jgi:hypothetical protein